jgi:hypothetical protein
MEFVGVFQRAGVINEEDWACPSFRLRLHSGRVLPGYRPGAKASRDRASRALQPPPAPVCDGGGPKTKKPQHAAHINPIPQPLLSFSRSKRPQRSIPFL